jgi:hypothetical protein
MTLSTISADTAPEAAWVQRQIYQRKSFDERLALTLDMSRSLRDIAMAVIKARNPDYTDEQARYATIRLRLGEELFRSAFPGVQLAK